MAICAYIITFKPKFNNSVDYNKNKSFSKLRPPISYQIPKPLSEVPILIHPLLNHLRILNPRNRIHYLMSQLFQRMLTRIYYKHHISSVRLHNINTA